MHPGYAARLAGQTLQQGVWMEIQTGMQTEMIERFVWPSEHWDEFGPLQERLIIEPKLM